ncbi:MAG: RNA polymerase sigma factor [Bacteroidetes bacterium]|nr:RNA polymerase sigma factor [Bacteroidota bacterium]
MPFTETTIEVEFLAIRDQLNSYLYRLTANREDAKDLVQETFLRVFEKAGTFSGKSSFKTWVFAIATNLAHDNQRVKNRWAPDVQDQCRAAARVNIHYQERMQNAFSQQTTNQFEITEHINYCFTCIAKNLSLKKQIAIILKEFYEFKRSEIAAIMELSEGIVKHLLFEGRKELQEKYQQRCALINKAGTCYQCTELNNHFQTEKDAEVKVSKLGFSEKNTPEQNLNQRFQLIQRINPLHSNGALLEDTILQILRETIQDR